jgi:ribosome-associated protein
MPSDRPRNASDGEVILTVLSKPRPTGYYTLFGRSRKSTELVMSLEVTVRGTLIPADELTWRFSRSPGPGGQSVNTADTRVELSYDLASSTALPPPMKQRALRALQDRLVNGVVTVTSSESRSQLRNREAAAARLGELLSQATAPPPPPRRPTKPSRGSVERRLAAKQRRATTKRLRRSTDD